MRKILTTYLATLFLFNACSYKTTNEIINRSSPCDSVQIYSTVFFKPGTSELDVDKSNYSLKMMVEHINSCGIKLELSVHTDERFPTDASFGLSHLKAEAILLELVKRGVSKELVVPKGMGAAKPLVRSAKTEEEHMRNRRVEIGPISK